MPRIYEAPRSPATPRTPAHDARSPATPRTPAPDARSPVQPPLPAVRSPRLTRAAVANAAGHDARPAPPATHAAPDSPSLRSKPGALRPTSLRAENGGAGTPNGDRGVSPFRPISPLTDHRPGSPRIGRASSPSYNALRGTLVKVGDSEKKSPSVVIPRLPGERCGGAGIQLTIQHQKDEQERVQKKTFTNWINSYLINHDPPYKVHDLFEDIKNGVVLLDLLSVLSGETLPKESSRQLKRVHFLNNIRRALDFLEGKKIRLVNINPSDIADGKPSIVLGLVWTIILYFQIEEQAELLQDQLGNDAVSRFKMSAKKALLTWAEKAITDKTGVAVDNFGKAWRDGVAFNALVHNVRPDLIDMDLVRQRGNRENLENAFTTAEAHLGIPRLLDPEDVDVEKPDEKSIMTYVAQFMKSYPDPDSAEAKADPLASNAGILQAYQLGQLNDPKAALEAEKMVTKELNKWLDNTDRKLEAVLDQPITDRKAEYADLKSLMKEKEKYEEIYNKLNQLYDSGKTQNMKEKDLVALKAHWEKTMQGIKDWQSKLDTSLPGRLGKVVNWLLDAEELVYGELIPAGATEAEIAAALKEKLAEHKDIFKDAEAMRKALASIKNQGKIDGVEIPKDQLEDLAKRLNKVTLVAPHVQKKLEYEEVKHRLASLMDEVDGKTALYGGKHGYQDEVDGLSKDYKKNVSDKKLLDTIEKTLAEYKKASDVYKNQVLDPKDSDEIEKIDKALESASSRWRAQSPELKQAGAMLDKVNNYWSQYNDNQKELDAWLNKAEQMMTASPEERRQFFKDFAKWSDKQKALGEQAEFLIGASDDPTAAEIRSTMQNIQNRFKGLGDEMEQKERTELAEQSRTDYKLGVGKIDDWLNNVEGLLEKETPCQSDNVQDLYVALEDANKQVEDVQNEFKVLSKTGQSLVKDSTQEAVSEMLGTLKVMKERLLKVKKEVPDRITKLKALQPQVEGIETGMADVSAWLDKAEDILDGNMVDGNMQNTAKELERHQALFAETSYYKNMLDSKNKAFQKMAQPKARVKNVDYDSMESDLKALTDRFKTLCSRLDRELLSAAVRPAKDLIQLTQHGTGVHIRESLDNLIARWQSVEFNAPIRQMKLEFAEPELTFTQNVEKAEKLLDEQQKKIDRKDDLVPVLVKHKEFFQQSNFMPQCDKCLSDMRIICDSLNRYYPDDKTLQESYAKHKDTWQNLKDKIDKQYGYLKTMPEKWKVYEAKMDAFEKWMDTVDNSIEELNKETDSKNQYQKKSEEFKRLVNEIDAKRTDMKWLVDTLDELLKEYSDEESKPHQEKLDHVLERYRDLMPKVEDADSLAATKLEGYDYKQNMLKKSTALADLMKGQEADVWKVDDIDKLRKALKNQERILARLDEQKADVEAALDAGRRLQDQEGCASFIPESVDELEKQWADAQKLAQDNYDKLKDNMSKYEDYEGARKKVLEFLKNAETECTRSASPGAGPDAVLKQLKAKEDYLDRLREMQPLIEEVEALNNDLCPDMTEKGEERLKNDMDALTNRLGKVSNSLNDAADELDEKNLKWEQLDKNIDELESGMKDLDEQMAQLQDPRISPEDQLKLAKSLLDDIKGKLPELEDAEILGKELSDNYRSRESANLKGKLGALRKHHDNLTNKAKAKVSSLSSDAGHYAEYQAALAELMPWLDQAEKTGSAEVPKCATALEADQVFTDHQDFLNDRDKFNAVFDKLNEEGAFLANNPQIASELQKLNRRWNNLMMQSDEKTMKVDKMHDQWMQYEDEKEKMNELCEKFGEELKEEPGLNSASVNSLEAELAKYMALQNELKGHQPAFVSMTQSFQQLRPNVDPAGRANVENAEEALENSWSDIQQATADRIQALQAEIDKRKGLYNKMDNFNEWADRLKDEVDGTDMIYEDEVGHNQEKLDKFRSELAEKLPEYERMIADVKELLKNCSEEERPALLQRLKDLEEGYDAINAAVEERAELCDSYADFHDTKTKAQAKLDDLMTRLRDPNLKPEELAQLKAELAEVQQVLEECAQRSDKLDGLMDDIGLQIQERGTAERERPPSSLAVVEDIMRKTSSFETELEARQSHMDKVDGMMGDLKDKVDELERWSEDCKDRIDGTKLKGTSAENIKDLAQEVKDLEAEIAEKKAQYDDLARLADEIEETDPAKAAEIRAIMKKMKDAWEDMEKTLAEKTEQVESVQNLFNEMEDAERSLADSLNDLDPLLARDINGSDLASVTGDLAEYKAAQEKLAKNRALMNQFMDKCSDLLTEGAKVDGFDGDEIDGRQELLEQKFQETEKKLAEKQEKLDKQKKLLDDIEATKADLNEKLADVQKVLAASAQNFGDPNSIQQQLANFKENLPMYKDMAQDLRDKIAELEAMGCYEAAAELKKMLADLEAKIAEAEATADDLEGQVGDYTARRGSIEDQMGKLADNIQAARDELAKCDDLTGTDKEISARLQKAREIKAQLAKDQKQMASLKGQLSELEQEFGASPETPAMVKEGEQLQKKVDSTVQKADKVEDSLEDLLEEQHQEALQDQQRWLNQAKDRLAWCQDTSGDKYAVEAKMATIQELLNSLPEGESKTMTLADKAKLLASLMPEKAGQINEQMLASEDGIKMLQQALRDAKSKLEDSVTDWKEYEASQEQFAKWLKDTEAAIKAESNLKPDLASKKQQLETFKNLSRSIQSHRPDLDDLLHQASELADKSNDARVTAQTGQLNARYNTAQESVKDWLEKLEQGVEDHENYQKKSKACNEWLEASLAKLDECKGLGDEKQDVQKRQDIIKDLSNTRDIGSQKMNDAVELSEKLYPTTASEGRELIRQDLRNTRDLWERFTDQLAHAQRDAENQAGQYSSFDESHDQLNRWLKELTHQAGPELKNTLQEKKSMQQQYKNQYQDIVSHESALDAVNDKAQYINTPSVNQKTDDLKNRFHELTEKAKENCRLCDEYVEQHSLYQDAYQQARDWLDSMNDKLSQGKEASSDKQAVHNKLTQVQDLLAAREEGHRRIEAARDHGTRTLDQTGSVGQPVIRRQLEGLEMEEQKLVEAAEQSKKDLEHMEESLKVYDDQYESLSQWVRDVEAQLRDHDLKSTLDEKQQQADKFKALQSDIVDKQPEFDNLVKTAQDLKSGESRLASYATQLQGRHQALKNNAQDVVDKWSDYASEHELYSEQAVETEEWLEALHTKLDESVKADGQSDKIEENKDRLKELASEKETGVSRIHRTVEAGERLFPNTAAPGRDQIRRQLRTIRDRWDQFCNQTTDQEHKLDSVLHQLSSYNESNDQFLKWVRETKQKMEENDELKANMAEKKMQLHAHKELHQDILSHQHVLDSITDKAHALSQSQPGNKMQDLTADMAQQYQQLCQDSKEILKKFETHCVDHQQYSDCLQDCTESVNNLKERTASCTDSSADKHTLMIRLDRLKAGETLRQDCEKKMERLQASVENVEPQTSPKGCDVITRDVTNAQQAMTSCLDAMDQSRNRLEATLDLWQTYDDAYDDLSYWLKNMEAKTRDYELKSTIDDKRVQYENFSALHDDVIKKQKDVDDVIDKANELQQAVSEARIQGYVNQMQNRYDALLSTIKDLMMKWSRYVQDHENYNQNSNAINDWLNQTKQKLDSCQDLSGERPDVEQKHALVQRLAVDKDIGLQKLNAAIESGEKLYPDTAAPGREKIRQELRNTKEDWDHLLNSLNDTQRKFDSHLNELDTCDEQQETLRQWLNDMEAKVNQEKEVLKNTLPEKKEQLQNHRVLLQDISSHHRYVDSALEKAQNLQVGRPKLKEQVDELSAKYQAIKDEAKALVQSSESRVQHHQQFHESEQTADDWLTLHRDRLHICNDVTGDRHAVHNRVERLQDLMKAQPEGEEKIQACTNLGLQTMAESGPSGQQTISNNLEKLKTDWQDYQNQGEQTMNKLQDTLKQWGQYETEYDRLSQWLKDMEKSVKAFGLVNSLDEKKDQLDKFQKYANAIQDKQGEFDDFVEEVQTLQQTTSDTRSVSQMAQLTSRLQTLQVTVREIVKKCEQNVSETELYQENYSQCLDWMHELKHKADESTKISGSRAELETKQDQITQLLHDKDAGFTKLSAAVEWGEKLYPNTASEGRELVRQQLRTLRLEWDSLFEELNASQRKLDGSLVQWRGIDDGLDQLEDWMKSAGAQLEEDPVLRATLEEKKSQNQVYKTLYQEVCSYQRVLDGVSDKAQSMAAQSAHTQLPQQLDQVTQKYKHLCTKAQDCVRRYEDFVRSHQQYQDAYQETRDWLSTMKDRLGMCNDVSGDRHAVQSRLERLQELTTSQIEGEPKVNKVTKLAEAVLPNTNQQGRDVIVGEVETLQSDWDDYKDQLEQTKQDLNNCVDQWKIFDGQSEKCANWLKETEHKLRDIDLKPTLADKKLQLSRLNGLLDAINAEEREFRALDDQAKTVFGIGGDNYVNSLSQQLNSRYKNLQTNAKELLSRWEQYVADHEEYDHSRDEVEEFQADYSRQLESCAEMPANRDEMGNKLEQMNDLFGQRDEGFRKLQTAADNMQQVLPNTSPAGRETMRREMADCQQNWDKTTAKLNESKSRLENAMSQLGQYDEGVNALEAWLDQHEENLREEQPEQGSVAEKKAALDRAKALQMAINAHQANVRNLSDKARGLQSSAPDPKLMARVEQLEDRYNTLAENAQDHVRTCDAAHQQHCAYRDQLAEAGEQISSVREKLLTCSDTRGDRQSVETKLQKVESLESRNENIENLLSALEQKASEVSEHTNPEGQEQIRDDIRAIRQEWDTYLNTVQDTQENLGRSLQQWSDYENAANQLTDWLKDMQNSLKNDNELKTTLKEKEDQLEKHQDQHDEIMSRQSDFDLLTEKAQSLIQSSGDTKLGNQVSQISSRYSALCSQSKEMVKKSEQAVDDHKLYKDSYARAIAWLSETQQKLAETNEPPTQRQDVQDQLEKLQEFVILREEGQGLLHSTNTLGEKTMSNTSIPGRDTVKQELQALQKDWDQLVANISDRKSSLDSCLLQWTDFDDSTKQVQKWLNDMRDKVNSIETKPELADKKVALQKAKSAQQDVASYQHMIDSLAKKARELEQKSPGIQVNEDLNDVLDEYEELKEMAEEAVKKNEKLVDDHQKYQEASAAYNNWLRGVKEKLAGCSDVYGDKDAVKAKMEKAKALEEALLDGEEKLERLQALADQVMPGTSLPGQARIKDDLNEKEKAYNDFRNELEAAEKDLDGCAGKWDDFEEKKDAFQDWLAGKQAKLKARPELQPNAESKEDQLAEAKELLQDILDHQADLDDVNDCAQALLETNADAKVSQAMTQMASKYQTMLNQANENVKKLENQAADHQNYDEANEDFLQWLDDTERKLDDIDPKARTKQELDDTLSDIMDLQSALDDGHAKLRSAQALADRVIPNTSREGAKRLRQQQDQNKDKYEKLKKALMAKKAELDNANSQWADVDRVHDKLDTWLNDMEARADRADSPGDMVDKKTELERCKAMLDDILGHGMSIDKLREKAAQLEGTELGDKVNEILERYDKLEKGTQDKVKDLAQQVADREAFKKHCQGVQDQMAEAKGKLGKLSDTTGDKHDIQARINKLGGFRKDLAADHAKMLEELERTAEKLMENATPEEKRQIRRDLEAAKEELAALAREANQAQETMDNCVLKWKNYQEAKARFQEWLDMAEADLKSIKGDKPTLEEKQRAFRKAEALNDDIAARKADLEDLSDMSKAILQTSMDPQVTNEMMQMSTRYQALAANAKTDMDELGTKMEQSVKDQRAYEVAYADCAQWLENSAENLNTCHNMAGDWNELEGRIDTVRDINSNLDEGQEKLNKACELAQKLLRNATPESRKAIQAQVDKLKEAWDNLQGNINICSTNLEKSLLKYNEYEESYDLVLNWMLDVENQLVPEPQPKAQLADKKQQLDKYKAIQTDIGYHAKQIDDLMEVAKQIQSSRPDKQLSKSVGEMKNNYDRLKRKSNEICDELEVAYNEHNDYHNAVQDAEKWILQQSFKVMSHNSMPVSGAEGAQRQQEDHAALMRDIAAYKSNIDNVKRRGERVIASNKDPVLESQIKAEVASLEESYNALLNTSEQIKDRLKDAQDKWDEYQKLLAETEKFLDKDATLWWIGKRKPLTDSVEHAHLQLHEANEMLSKLQQLKQDLASAGHQCEPTDGNKPDDKQAQRIKDALQDNIDKVKERIDGLRDATKGWQKLDEDKAEMRDWLRGQQAELKDAKDRPAKLNTPAAEREKEKIKQMKAAADQKKPLLDKLHERHRDLTYHDPSLRDPALRSLQDDYDELVGALDNLADGNKQFGDTVDGYNAQQKKMDDLLNAMETMQREDAGQLHAGMKAGSFASLGDLTDTATQTPYESATQTPQSMLRDRENEAALPRRYLSPSLASLNRSNPALNEEDETSLRNSGDKVGLSHQFWPYKSRADSPGSRPNSARPPSGRPLSSSLKRLDPYGSTDTGLGESPAPWRSQSASPDRRLPSPLRFGAQPYDDLDALESPEIRGTPFLRDSDIPTFDDYTQTVPVDNMSTQTGPRKSYHNTPQQTEKGRKTPSIVMSGRGTPNRLDDLANQVEQLKASVDDLRRPGSRAKKDDDTWSEFGSEKDPVDTQEFASQTPGHRRTQTPNHAMTQTKKKPWQRNRHASEDSDDLTNVTRSSPFRNHLDSESESNYPIPTSRAQTQTPYNARTQTPYQASTQTDRVPTSDTPMQTDNRQAIPTQTPSHSSSQTKNGRLYPHDVIPNRPSPKGVALKNLLDTIKTMSKELEEHNKARAAYDSGFSSDRDKKDEEEYPSKQPLNPLTPRAENSNNNAASKPWLKYIRKNKEDLPRSRTPVKADRTRSPTKASPEKATPLSRRALTPSRDVPSRDYSPPTREGRFARRANTPTPRSELKPYKSPYDDDEGLAHSKTKFSSMDSIPRVIPAYHFTPVYPVAPARSSPKPTPRPRLPDGTRNTSSFVRDYNDSTLHPERYRSPARSDAMDRQLDSATRSADHLLNKSGKIKGDLRSELREY